MSELMKTYKEEVRDIYEWMYTKKITKLKMMEGLGIGRIALENILDGRSNMPEFMMLHEFCKNYTPNR